jgi:hypothetical protein
MVHIIFWATLCGLVLLTGVAIISSIIEFRRQLRVSAGRTVFPAESRHQGLI